MVKQSNKSKIWASGPFPLEPITVRPSTHPRQFWVEGVIDGETWEEQNIQFSGFFGKVGPHVFAAGPDLLEPAKRYIAQIDAIGLPDDEVTSLFRAAIAKAEGRS